MLKRSHYNNPVIPYLLILPQLFVTVFFFFWPAGAALIQAFQLSDPFGQGSQFVGLENFKALFATPEYRMAIYKTILFSFLTAFVSIAIGLFLATLTNRLIRFRKIAQTLLIWPYAVAPAMAGILWLFLFHPSYGVLGYILNSKLNFSWNPILNPNHALVLVVLASSWKQISYNFVFFLSGLQSIPKSVIEAASLDGASPFQRYFAIVLPLLSPTIFFLMVMNLIYALFDTFGVIHATTQGGPGGATNTMVYKVYLDGFVGLDLGSSAAQSVILMVMTVIFTIVQFKYVEKKVHYAGS